MTNSKKKPKIFQFYLLFRIFQTFIDFFLLFLTLYNFFSSIFLRKSFFLFPNTGRILFQKESKQNRPPPLKKIDVSECGLQKFCKLQHLNCLSRKRRAACEQAALRRLLSYFIYYLIQKIAGSSEFLISAVIARIDFDEYRPVKSDVF